MVARLGDEILYISRLWLHNMFHVYTLTLIYLLRCVCWFDVAITVRGRGPQRNSFYVPELNFQEGEYELSGNLFM